MDELPNSELITQLNEETGRFEFESVKVLPQSLYDATRAQTAHHIKWILSCAYPQGLPDSLGTPFYIGNDSRLVLSPHVISGLVSCHVYSLGCSHLFDDSATHPNANEEDQNHWHKTHSAILTQLASVWSLYPMEQAMLQDGSGTASQLESESSGAAGANGVPVTEQMLSQTLPFRLASHVAMIESLIMARCLVVSPISRVVSETRALCQREDAEELSTGMEELLPYDMEDALLFWINHCLLCLKKRHPTAKALDEVMELFDIVEACDGLVICVIMSLFSPRALPVERLSEQNHSLGIPSESLAINCIYNIQIVQMYCQQLKNDPQRLFDRTITSKLAQTTSDILHLELEDFLYPNKLTKSAFVLFIAELFHLYSTVFGESLTDGKLDNARSESRTEKSIGNISEGKGGNSFDKNRDVPQLNHSGSGGSSENSRESGDPDTTLEAIDSARGVDESIDMQSLGSLFNSVPSADRNHEKGQQNQIQNELLNSTYVHGRQESGYQKEQDQRTVEGAEGNNGRFFLGEGEVLDVAGSQQQQSENRGNRVYHRSNSTGAGAPVTAFTNRSSIASGPLGASTPSGDNSRSPQPVRKGFTSPVQGTGSSTVTSSSNQPPVIQSGKDTYSVRSSHVNQHRPASELFGDVHESNREPREMGNERPRSEILDGSHEIRLKGFGHARTKTPEKESEPPSNRSSQNDEESLADNFKSLRAEMEMKRLQIQKQRAHEDKERMKQRQKISEAAFFKAIQPRSQDQRGVASATGTPQHRHSGSLPVGDPIVRNPSMSNISVQTSIETPDVSGYPLMTGTDEQVTGGGQRHFEEYERSGTSVGGSQSFRHPVASGKSNDIHRTTSLDWTKSGLGSPLDAPGNVSYRGPNALSYRGLQNPRKSGSTYDMSGLGMGGVNQHTGYPDQHPMAFQQPPLALNQHEKAEKQLLIEQNLKLAQELKFLKAQYANEIGHSPEYGLSTTSQRGMYPPVPIPPTPSHHPVGSGSMLTGSIGHTMGSWGHKLNSSFSNYPPDHNSFMASIGNNPTMAAMHQQLGYQHPTQTVHSMNVVAPQPQHNYTFEGSGAQHGNYNSQMMGSNAAYQGFPVPATAGGMRASPMGSQSMLSMDERNQRQLSGSHSFLTIEAAGNRRGAEGHMPSHDVSSESEDAQSVDQEQEDDGAFHQVHSNLDEDYDNSGTVKRGDSGRYGSEAAISHRSNRATSRGRGNSYRSDVDTLEAPFGVAELVNVQTGGNTLSNPGTSLSRRHSERDREFVSTGIVASPMAERRTGVASRNSMNQTISTANYHQSLPRYRGEQEDGSEGVSGSERSGTAAGVPPCGVALIIGEEGDEMKLVDYETKKKVMLTKRMERLKAEQKNREEAMRAEKEKLKEHQRKLQLEIDSHRRQEKLKEKQQQQNEGTARSGSSVGADDKSSGVQTLPNRGTTNTNAVKRPKAKVAPRVKSSTSNQDLNSSGHLGSKNQHEEASKQATGTPLKLYVKPQSRGNRQIIVNAINQCVLPGAVNADLKSKVLKEMNSLEGETKNFLLLFRDHNMKYRALYSYEPDTGLILKILGNGPNHIKEEMIAQLYKYNSGNKCFSSIPSKTMSVSVDGFTILNHLWKTNTSSSSSTATAAHSNRRPP